MIKVRPSFIKSLQTDYEFTLWDKIEDKLWYNPFSIFLRKTGRFITRVIRWLPVLWKQEEWDFGYTYNILEFKLKELRNNIAQDTWHDNECVQEELQQIDSVLDHLDKYRNWPKYIEIPEPPKDFKRFTPTEDGCSRLNFTEQEHKAYDKARKFEEEHYNAFWNEMKENSDNWWT